MSSSAVVLLLLAAMSPQAAGVAGVPGEAAAVAQAAEAAEAGEHAVAGVAGMVRTSDSGEGLAYARVQVVGDSISDWTDDTGAYRLEGLTRGEWRIRAIHPGHDSLELTVFVPGDRDVRLDVTLEARPGPEVDALADFEPIQVEITLPALLNADDVTRAMRALYPPELTRDRIGGEAVLLLWLDERGRVVRREVTGSSGQAALDSIALTISDSMRFRPARNGDRWVRVIVRIPIMFTVPEDSLPPTDRG